MKKYTEVKRIYIFPTLGTDDSKTQLQLENVLFISIDCISSEAIWLTVVSQYVFVYETTCGHLCRMVLSVVCILTKKSTWHTYIFSWMSQISRWREISLFSHQMESGKSSVSPIDVTLSITTVVLSHRLLSHFTWSLGGNPSTTFSIWFSLVFSPLPPPSSSSICRQSLGKRWL